MTEAEKLAAFSEWISIVRETPTDAEIMRTLIALASGDYPDLPAAPFAMLLLGEAAGLLAQNA